MTLKKDQKWRYHFERQHKDEIGINTGDGNEDIDSRNFIKAKIEESVCISFPGPI